MSDHTQITAGNVGVDFLAVTLDAEWGGLNTYVTFQGCAQDSTTVDYAAELEVPWEQIEEAGDLYIGVQGFDPSADVSIDTEGQLVTNGVVPVLNAMAMTVPIKVRDSGAASGVAPSEPTPGTLQRVEQNLLALEKLTEGAGETIANAETAASSANAAAASANAATSDAITAEAERKQTFTEQLEDWQRQVDAKVDEWQQEVSAIIGAYLHYDEVKGEYTNIEEYFYAHRDGKSYGVSYPKYGSDSSITCTKLGANAGLVMEPSTATTQGRDDYSSINCFFHMRCNGYVDADGMPHVTAIKGDSRYKEDGSNGDVLVLKPTIYCRHIETESLAMHYWSDSPLPGYEVIPGGLLPDGRRRPFMLYAAFAASKGSDGYMHSVAGANCWNRTLNHSMSHTAAAGRGAGYSGKTHADDYMHKMLFMMKYAKKSSQAVMAGCSNYYFQYPVTVAESGVKRVVLSDSNAANLLVGSCIQLGTSTAASVDRNMASSYSVFDSAMILSKEALGDGNTALYVDTANVFDTTVGAIVSTTPYRSGYCNSVLGPDGSPVSFTSGKEPLLLDEMELMVGAFEILSDTILKGSPTQEVWCCYDCASYATSITASYVKVGEYTGNADTWNYTKDIAFLGGYLLPQGTGASSTTGTGDGWYPTGASTSLYEWLGVGSLSRGAVAGLFCVDGVTGLPAALWDIAGRLSLIGRTAAPADVAGVSA